MKIKRHIGTILLGICIILYVLPVLGNEVSKTIKVGSKNSTESVILGEMLSQMVKKAGSDVIHQRQLGGTRVLWDALLNGEIDAYPEYTGTLQHELLAEENLRTREQIKAALATRGLNMTQPLGFNNTYAIGMKDKLAEYLIGWMGGPPIYAQKYGSVCMTGPHKDYAIGASERDQWLLCMDKALERIDASEELKTMLKGPMFGIADAVKNR